MLPMLANNTKHFLMQICYYIVHHRMVGLNTRKIKQFMESWIVDESIQLTEDYIHHYLGGCNPFCDIQVEKQHPVATQRI